MHLDAPMKDGNPKWIRNIVRLDPNAVLAQTVTLDEAKEPVWIVFSHARCWREQSPRFWVVRDRSLNDLPAPSAPSCPRRDWMCRTANFLASAF